MSITKVAIQGDRASFHEIAAIKYYTEPIELVYCQTFEQVFDLLKNNSVDKVFVAVKNTSHGEINVVKELKDYYQPIIEGEYPLRIEQHVVGLPNADMRGIKTIISHPIALSQCSVFIDSMSTEVSIHEYYDTSAAIEFVKKSDDPAIVAIGSEYAAQFHGLRILKRNIQNTVDNTTVFESLTTNPDAILSI